MEMAGMQATSLSVIQQVILLAADINNGAFLPDTVSGGGWGNQIADNSLSTSVYSSTHDPLLKIAKDAFKSQHNPDFPDRLGLEGPTYSSGQMNEKMVAVDCSAVVEEWHLEHLRLEGYVPSLTNLHSSYRYIPQVLWDICQTLNQVSPDSVFDRTPASYPNAYTMFKTDPS